MPPGPRPQPPPAECDRPPVASAPDAPDRRTERRRTTSPPLSSPQTTETLERTYRTLGEAATVLLRRMSVFAGPATLGMLEELMVALPLDTAAAFSPSQGTIGDTVAELVGRRMVTRAESPGEPAFTLADRVRDFAGDRLVDVGELDAADLAHGRAVLDFAVGRGEAVDVGFDGVAQAELARSEADLHTVLGRLTERAQVHDGLRLCCAVVPFVLRRGYDGLVGAALTSLLRQARDGDLDDVLLTRAQLGTAWLAAQLDGPDAAAVIRTALAQALPVARDSGDPRLLLEALACTVHTMPTTGDRAGAAAAAAEGLRLAEATDARWAARLCAWAGTLAQRDGDEHTALELARRGVAHVTSCGDPEAAMLLANLLAGLPPERAAPLVGQLPPTEDVALLVRRLGWPEPRIPAQSTGRTVHNLTRQESEVLRELTTGATGKEIAVRLGMSPRTVTHHCMAVYRKLGVRGRAEATAWAFRHGAAR